VLVGRHAAYAALPFEQLEDAPSLDGPSGGLVSLLERALARGTCALALASDMPWLTSELLLRVALSHPHAAAVAPRRSRWECLVARYEPARVLPLLRERSARGAASLQGLFAELGSAAVEIELSPAEAAALNDWDTPEDVRQQRPPSLGRGERGTHASPFPLR
jgi:molybdopterin-guanine dinucleotide biosynthesis protein A